MRPFYRPRMRGRAGGGCTPPDNHGGSGKANSPRGGDQPGVVHKEFGSVV